MVKSATMGGLLENLTTIFQIKSYLQRPIEYAIGMAQTILLYIAYNSQHFEPIEYAIGMARFSLTFETMISSL